MGGILISRRRKGRQDGTRMRCMSEAMGEGAFRYEAYPKRVLWGTRGEEEEEINNTNGL
jgi:hypothetical protein